MEDDPSYDIAIARVSGHTSTPDAYLVSAIHAALSRHRACRATISVALVDDAQMATLNEKHLNHTGPTDVLTFDLRDDIEDRTEQPIPPDVEGEIILSIDTASRVAKQRGHAEEAELALYAVHGTLHLLGYEDADATQAARMHDMEDEILESLGVGPVYRASGT